MCRSGVLTQTSRDGISASGRFASRLILDWGEVPVLCSIKVKIAGKADRAVSIGDAAATLASVP